MKIKHYNFPLIIIGFGILFSLYLQWQIPDGVFFSGDAGLKALLARQLSGGQMRFDLVPPSETWVRDLWQHGLYPFQEPYVYQFDSKYYITFPFTFPLITAPFYALFGYRGLYLIPIISTWAIWLTFYGTCQGLKFSKIATSIGIALLIFTSYLSLYSAMYWEHNLAVALAFYGISNLLVSGYLLKLSKKDAILSGVAIGLSVWFRPEFLSLVAILIGLVCLAALSQLSQFDLLNRLVNFRKISWLSQHKEILLGSTILTISLFFLCNKLIYNHPLGIHAIQVVEKIALSDRLLAAWGNFTQLTSAIFEYLPITFFSVIYLLISLFRKPGVPLTPKIIITYIIGFIGTSILIVLLTTGFTRKVWLLLNIAYFIASCLISAQVSFTLEIGIVYLSCFLFIVGVALMVPVGTAGLIAGGKQWGPRFLLILVPIISLLASQELDVLVQKTRPIFLKYMGIGIFSLLVILGVQKNVYLGTTYLNTNNQVILPVIEFLQTRKERVIGMSHEFVAQALEPALSKDKLFFRAEDSKKLVQLGAALVKEGEDKFIYVCYPHRDCLPPTEAPENFQFTQENRNFTIELSKLGDFGKYPVYEAAIIGK